jgi:hypothetical protein
LGGGSVSGGAGVFKVLFPLGEGIPGHRIFKRPYHLTHFPELLTKIFLEVPKDTIFGRFKNN